MARIVDGPEITGQVVHKQTGQAYGPVTVTVSPKVYTDREMTASVTSLTTDGTGVFSCYAPPGTYTFTTTAVDAQTLESVEVLGREGGTGGSAASGAGLPATIVGPKTTTYTASAGEFVECDTTSAGFTVTLPSNPAVGALVTVKKISADLNTLIIAPAGAGTIDGDPNATTATRWTGGVFEHKGSDVWRITATMHGTGSNGAGFGSAETVNAQAAVTGAYTIPDISAATMHRLVLTGNATFTFPTAAAGKSFAVLLVQDATGSRTATWPGTVKWPAATAPTLTTTASKADQVGFSCYDGTNWIGSVAGQNL